MEPFSIGASTGKTRRINRLFPKGRPVVVAALDDALIAGPYGISDLKSKIRFIGASDADAVLAHPGLRRWNPEELASKSIIANVTASLKGKQHVVKEQVIPVDLAINLGADAIACHANIYNSRELEMIRTLGRVSDDCVRLGFPLLAIVYPRDFGESSDNNYEDERESSPQSYLARLYHCVQVAKDMGADFVKTHLVDDERAMKQLVQDFDPLPILFSGGPVVQDALLKKRCLIVAKSRAAGVSFGRNIFMKDDPQTAIRSIRSALVGQR